MWKTFTGSTFLLAILLGHPVCHPGTSWPLLSAEEPALKPRAAVKTASENFTLNEEWKEPVEKCGEFLHALSLGNLEDAWQKYRIMLHSPPKTAQGPFEPDPYDSFVKQIGRFPSGLESLSLIGERRLTPNARRFTFIADSVAGPTVVNILIYRVKGEWFFATLNYHLVAAADAIWFQQMDELFPVTRFTKPYPLPLSQSGLPSPSGDATSTEGQ